ncbi:MAG TPA: putative DNA-binding domain-containing protein [Polyangiaceae bacterium]
MTEDEAREAAFVEACLAKGKTPEGAMAIYRRLVRTNVAGVVFKLLPRTRARMNAAHGDAFDSTLVDFLDAHGPSTHHLRDAPGELVAFALPRWEESRIDRSLLDLARYEAAIFAVEAAPADPPQELGELDLERALVFTQSLRLERFAHAVHEVAEDAADLSPIEKRDVVLLLWRDSEHDVTELELEAPYDTFLEALLAGKTLREAVMQVGLGELETLAAFLGGLAERGAVLGARV